MKKESTASFFVNFERNRGTKEPAYITVPDFKTNICLGLFLEWEGLTVYCLFPEKFHKEGKPPQKPPRTRF